MSESSIPGNGSGVTKVTSLTEVDALEARIRDAADKASTALRALADRGLPHLHRLRFEPIGSHPLHGHPLNIVEQINQTFTCLVGLEAVRWLLRHHPDVGGFRLALGAVPGFDVESVVPDRVQAETFAAVNPANNRKLVKDVSRLRDKGTAEHRYVFFAAPGIPAGEYKQLQVAHGVQVRVVDVKQFQ